MIAHRKAGIALQLVWYRSDSCVSHCCVTRDSTCSVYIYAWLDDVHNKWWGISSVGRARAQHARGLGFDSRILQDEPFVHIFLLATFCLFSASPALLHAQLRKRHIMLGRVHESGGYWVEHLGLGCFFPDFTHKVRIPTQNNDNDS